MRPFRGLLLLSVCIVSVSCGGSEPSTGTGNPASRRLEVSPDSLLATAIGQTLAVTVTIDGAPASASFSLRSERRWLNDREVLDPTALSSARLVARAPGRAVVSVAAGGLTDSVIVNVAPTQVVVMDAQLPGGRTHLGDGDTIVLRGYRLNQLTAGNVSTSGVPVGISGADSANARLVVPTLVTTGCGGAAPMFNISFNGAQGSAIDGLSQKRSGELVLAPGQARRLTDAEAACIRLPRSGSSRYLVAYADTRLVTKAQTGPEYPWPDSILVAGADRSNASSAVAVSPAELAEHVAGTARRLRSVFEMSNTLQPHDDVLSKLVGEHKTPGVASAASLPTGCPYTNSFLPFCRASPYTVGDVFPFYPAGSQRPVGQSRVLSIRGNLVAAVFLPDSSKLPGNTTANVDSALNVMRLRTTPLLQRIFDIGAPTRTSEESGQLFISLETIDGTTAAFANWWPDPLNGHGRWGKVTLGLAPNAAVGDPTSNPVRVFGVTAHEVLHTYQFRWRFEHASPWSTYLGTGWGVEGAASFFGMEMVRELLGIGFSTNYTIGSYASTDPLLSMTVYAARVNNLTDGYSSAASFLRDLTQRLVDDAGMSFDDAIREVIVGALEGWYGINEEGQARGLGLTARMRARLGTSWNPIDALLDWTMSQAADDQTTNTRYQNRTVRLPPGSTFALLEPHATLSIGTSVSVLRPAGNTGVYRINDTRGGSYSMTATIKGASTDALEWLILRVN